MLTFRHALFLCCLLLAGTSHALDNNADSAAGNGVPVATLMAVNDHEIKAAETAMKKDVSAPVKNYAQMMKDEHGDNQSKTKDLSKSVKPVENAEVKSLKEKTAASRESLSKLDGAAFEKAYVEAMVKDHSEVLAMLDNKLIPGATDPKVVDHLKATRESVAHHLHEAKKLNK